MIIKPILWIAYFLTFVTVAAVVHGVPGGRCLINEVVHEPCVATIEHTPPLPVRNPFRS